MAKRGKIRQVRAANRSKIVVKRGTSYYCPYYQCQMNSILIITNYTTAPFKTLYKKRKRPANRYGQQGIKICSESSDSEHILCDIRFIVHLRLL